jgi:xylose isomerase
MDAFAVGLQAAQRIIDDEIIPSFVKDRYASFTSGDGARFSSGDLTLDQLAKIGSDAGYGKTGLTSGKQEYLENVLNSYLLGL